MSSWLWPTTADVGMRIFGKDFPDLLTEAAHGMQQYLMSEKAVQTLNDHVRHSGVWMVRSPHQPEDQTFLFLAWLDEILYRAEVHHQWYTSSMVQIMRDEQGWTLSAQVEWVDSDLIEREIEIKAVTTHELIVRAVAEQEEIPSKWEHVPSFTGPGWYADVVFDI